MEKNDQNSTDFEEAKKLKSSEFYDKLEYIATRQHRTVLFFFGLSYLTWSQIWLNYFLDDCHFDYMTKS